MRYHDELAVLTSRKDRCIFKSAFLLMLGLAASGLRAQGITRSSGLGLRGSFWKVQGRSSGIRVDGLTNSASVDVEGAGGCLTFFSRLHDNWFMECALGKVSSIHIQGGGSSGSVKSSSMIPLLIGTRYDFLTGRMRSAIQPYVCGGAGTYGLTQTDVDSRSVLDASVSIGTDFHFGGYFGAGAYVAVSNWFALNADARYHLVDFSRQNPNSGYELGFGFCFMWGARREIFKVRSVKVIVEDLYPAYYRFYNTYPLAMAAIENTAGYPIEVNLRSWINRVTDGVRQSGFVTIPRGETRDFPVLLLFGRNLFLAENREPAVIQLEIEARAGNPLKKSFSVQVTVHSRNAWNGEIDKLPVFVTPDDSAIQALSRSVLNQDTTLSPPGLKKFSQAKRLFESLRARGIRYQSDPNIPFDRDDRVQSAPNSLTLGSGDCDDLAVLSASLLESAGISTAFVDVKDPKASQGAQGHVYLMFDAGLSPEQWGMVSANEKRTIVREDESGKATLWIPLETTLIAEGFESAWRQGATQYAEEALLRNGLAEGWVKIIDIE